MFVQAFKWLESSNADLTTLIASGSAGLSGDIYFNGDLKQWQKVVNTLRMRLLLELSKKAGDADLNVPGQFAAIVGNPTKYPLMTSAADNMQLLYNAATNNFYPNNNRNFGQGRLAQEYVGHLRGPAHPAPRPARVRHLRAGPLPGRYPEAESDRFRLLRGRRSRPRPGCDVQPGRQAAILVSEPQALLLHPHRRAQHPDWLPRAVPSTSPRASTAAGLAGASAETYYTAGIQASMAFYGLPTERHLHGVFLPARLDRRDGGRQLRHLQHPRQLRHLLRPTRASSTPRAPPA